MEEIAIVNMIIGISLFLIFNIAAFVSVFEHEKKAALRFFVISWLLLALFTFSYFIEFNLSIIISGTLLIVTIHFFALIIIPYKGKFPELNDMPFIQHDERDTMFSRKELKPDSDRYNKYYSENPDKKKPDDKFRTKPGLLSPKAPIYDPVIFASSEASFYTVAAFKDFVDGEINSVKTNIDNKSISNYIKNWGKKLGAIDLGFTTLKSYHIYSVKGRGEKYGNSIINNHKYAIAFTVEMDKFNVDTAPDAPEVFESAQQYLRAGTVAVQIAKFIRELGYSAKAHIDGNYDLICPLVARDAGLGEIGRMGLLMTPKLGPRVRIAVITTDIPLVTGIRKIDHSLLHFCKICKKCAESCPGKAIPFENRQNIDGTHRWKINSESCYTYWCTVGTDCGKCIKVCPYAHPDNLLHNIVRKGIKNNLIFRHLALHLDNFFYGKNPVKNKFPKWMKIKYD